MKLSYAITVYNELEEIKRLINFLLSNKREEDEIVVLWDNSGDIKVFEYLSLLDIPNFTLSSDTFNKHFADWKNQLSTLCTGDYIINIDADELPSMSFMENVIGMLEENSEIDVFIVPRWNIVKGITEEHIKQWGWNVDEYDRVNWPDYQMRVYKNNCTIEWINSVHEILTGFMTFAPLPDSMYFEHYKTIERQEIQNNLYKTI
jgi:hypothetical protein